MLDRIASNGVRRIIAESPDRFVRDLTVQLTGHDFLKSLGVSLIPATAPDFFTEDTPLRCSSDKCSVPSPNSQTSPMALYRRQRAGPTKRSKKR